MTETRPSGAPGSAPQGPGFGRLSWGLGGVVGAGLLCVTAALSGAPADALAGPETPAPVVRPRATLPGARSVTAAPLGRHACRPSCKARKCGSDGCGGSCGTCGKTKECWKGRCVVGRGPEICRGLIGPWSGTLYTSPTHYFSGRVYLSGSSCHARFTVTYQLTSGPARVVQEMRLSLTGRTLRWKGIRLVSASSNTNYWLDDFTGTLDRTRRRFTGRNKDARGSRSRVYLYKR